jgi:hypothetical protein
MPATVDEATLLVFFDDIESTNRLYVFKIIHLSDEATVSVLIFKFYSNHLTTYFEVPEMSHHPTMSELLSSPPRQWATCIW